MSDPCAPPPTKLMPPGQWRRFAARHHLRLIRHLPCDTASASQSPWRINPAPPTAPPPRPPVGSALPSLAPAMPPAGAIATPGALPWLAAGGLLGASGGGVAILVHRASAVPHPPHKPIHAPEASTLVMLLPWVVGLAAWRRLVRAPNI